MGEHAREALPRLHLVLGHQQAHVLPQGVEGAQQGALTRHPPYVGETEREIMVQHGLAHQVGAPPESALVTDVTAGDHYGHCQQKPQMGRGKRKGHGLFIFV